MSMPQKYLIAIRTHFWDETVQRVADTIFKNTTAPVVVSADETNGPVNVPSNFTKVAHSNTVFEGMGLPLFPTSQRALWYNGDYPLYHLAEQHDFDYLLMIESDCAMTGAIDLLLRSLAEEGVDLATKNFGPRAESYRWHKESMRWFEPHLGADSIYGGLFPAVFASRSAIENLKNARLSMLKAGVDADNWVHCEPFTATHLHLSGFKCVALSEYAGTDDVTIDIPVHIDEVTSANPASGRVTFFHPVLDGHKYAKRWRDYNRGNANKITALIQENKRLIRTNSKLTKTLLQKQQLETESLKVIQGTRKTLKRFISEQQIANSEILATTAHSQEVIKQAFAEQLKVQSGGFASIQPVRKALKRIEARLTVQENSSLLKQWATKFLPPRK